jgi:AcrR family transcriptional regulator
MGRPKTISDEKLLKIAREVFLAHGASGSTKQIAERARVSEAALFQRYPAKAKLFLAAMVPPEVDTEAVFAGIGDVEDPRAALALIGRRMLAFFRKLIPVALHLLTHPDISVKDFAPHFRTAPPQALVGGLEKALAEMATRGQIHAGNHHETAAIFVAALHSLPLFELLEMHGGRDLEHAVDAFVAALWNGLNPDTHRNQTALKRKKK